MPTVLVVDGYNAINAIPETRKCILNCQLRTAREKIIRISKDFSRSSGYITDVRVVFDGDDRYRTPLAQRRRKKEEIYSRTGKGDQKIIATVRRYSEFAKVVLVSNDNYVRNNARSYGASILPPDNMLRRQKSERPGGHKKISGKIKKMITDEYKRHLGL